MAVALSSTRIEGGSGAVFAPIFGAEEAADPAPSDLPPIARPLEDLIRREPGILPTYVIVHDPATAGQHVQLIAAHPRRLIFGDYYEYDAQGIYRGNVGISDGTVGQQVVGSVYNVHFGNWGGLPVKLAYLVFGLCLSVVVASGLSIYFTRRAERGRPAPRLEGAWEGVVWGTPASLGASLLAAIAAGAEGAALAALFWGALIAATAFAARAGKAPGGRLLRLAASGLVLLSLMAHAARYGADAAGPAALGTSASLLLAAVLLALPEARALSRRARAA